MDINEIREDSIVVTYRQFLSGLLLRMNEIDSVDFSLIIKEFEKKENLKLSGNYYSFNKQYIEYVEAGGIFKLKYDLNSDTGIKDYLKEEAGDIVNDYFSSFNFCEYKKEKARLLEIKKTKFTTANVLLISKFEEDYDELKNYGLKNIKFFKSIVVASRYFDENPKEFNQYNIVLIGEQDIFYWNFAKFLSIERKLEVTPPEFLLYLKKYDEIYSVDFIDRKNNRSYKLQDFNVFSIYDGIVANMLINGVMGSDKLMFPLPNEFENTGIHKLLLQSKNDDLKILFFSTKARNIPYLSSIIKANLGLNVELYVNDISDFQSYATDKLGEYDIIIVDKTCFRKNNGIICMRDESTNQCQFTGRCLTALVEYEILNNIFTLNYTYGGILFDDEANNEICEEKFFSDLDSDFSNILAIIESSVIIYNKKLIKEGKMPLQDFRLKYAKPITSEDGDKTKLLKLI